MIDSLAVNQILSEPQECFLPGVLCRRGRVDLRPRVVEESVRCAGINVHFVRHSLLAHFRLKGAHRFHRYAMIVLGVQAQHRHLQPGRIAGRQGAAIKCHRGPDEIGVMRRRGQR